MTFGRAQSDHIKRLLLYNGNKFLKENFFIANTRHWRKKLQKTKPLKFFVVKEIQFFLTKSIIWKSIIWKSNNLNLLSSDGSDEEESLSWRSSELSEINKDKRASVRFSG
jgi:hypothetical protein